MSGNAGIKDQVMALQWVQKNILYFGGDPDRVTIGGIDAGAACVEYLMVSTLTRGLFNRVILMSGNSLAYWAQGKQHGMELAHVLESKPKNYTEMEAFNIINKFNAYDIVQATGMLTPEASASSVVGPIIEPMNARAPVITRMPQDIINTKNFNYVPYMTGFTSLEGIFALMLYKLNTQAFPKSVADFERLLPEDMHLIPGSNKSARIAMQVKEFYYGNERPSMRNIEQTFKVS